MLRAFLVTAVFLCGVLLGRDAERRLRQRRDLLAELIAAVKAAADAHGVRAPAACPHGGRVRRRRGRARVRRVWRGAGKGGAARRRLGAGGGMGAAARGRVRRAAPGRPAVLRAFMESLGAAGMEGEKRNAELALAQLERRREEADAAYGSRGRVCRAMGALCGAAVALLLL